MVPLCRIVVSALFATLFVLPSGPAEGADESSKAGTQRAFEQKLLDLAMSTASAIPKQPHIKDRSRMQHEVFEAYLELGRPEAARRIARKIDNWRRGAAAAELALFYARRDQEDKARPLLKIAKAQALLADQAWRQEHIAFYAAQARRELGEADVMEAFHEQIQTDLFRGRLDAAVEDAESDEAYAAVKSRLDDHVAGEVFDPTRNAAQGYATLYRMHFGDAQRRRELEKAVRKACSKMGKADLIEFLEKLADAALAHDNREVASRFAAEMHELVGSIEWSIHREYEYEFRARAAELMHRVGRTEEAGRIIDRALETYRRRKKDSLLSMRWADCVRPLAAAYQRMGAADAAQQAYALAVEDGGVNVNARVRAIDLTKTAISMAMTGFRPDEALFDDMDAIGKGLKAPW